jgi:signal transduction histidine kinase/CheY-like chemotaxis protein
MNRLNPNGETAHHPNRTVQQISLRRQLLDLMGLLLLLSLVVVGVAVYTFIASAEERSWQGRHVEAANNATATVQAFLLRIEDTLTVVGSLEIDILTGSPRTLETILEENPALLEIIRLDETGAILASASRDTPVLANLFSIPQSNWFQYARTGQRYLGNLQLSSANEPYIIVAMPSRSGGVVGARLRMTVLWDTVSAIQVGETGSAYVINRDGQIIAHRDHLLVRNYERIADSNIYDQVALQNKQQPYTNVQGIPVIGVVSPIESTDWLIITELPQAESSAIRNAALIILGGSILGFSLLVTVLMTRLLNQLIFRPIGQLQAGAERVGQGDLQHHIGVIRNDEIGLVAASFNTMIDRLRERDHQIMAQNEALTTEIDERISTEMQLVQARDAAETANRAKTAFLATMSHELRTPLTAILGYTELMKLMIQEGAVADIEQDLDRISTSGKHLLTLISDILDHSKIEADKMVLDYEIVELQPLITEVVETIYPLVERNQNQLVVHVANNIGTIEADLTKVRQILLNVLSNATKFTEQGTITLTVERIVQADDGWFQFEIRDTGIGITDEQMVLLFQPFSQVDSSNTRRYGGTGLGLALSKRFCELHGGTISVTSRHLIGSTFTILLPAQPAAVPESTPGSTSVPDAAMQGRTIPPAPGERQELTMLRFVSSTLVLVIDNDPALCQMLTDTLQIEGFSVAIASDPARGIEMAQAIYPELILLDTTNPEWDAVQTLEALISDANLLATPIILMTQAGAVEAPAFAGYRTIHKPVQPTELLHALHTPQPT